MARIYRRKLLQLSSAGAVAAKAGGIASILATARAPAYAQSATVHWLRWNDFDPATFSDALLKKEIAPEAEKGSRQHQAQHRDHQPRTWYGSSEMKSATFRNGRHNCA